MRAEACLGQSGAALGKVLGVRGSRVPRVPLAQRRTTTVVVTWYGIAHAASSMRRPDACLDSCPRVASCNWAARCPHTRCTAAAAPVHVHAWRARDFHRPPSLFPVIPRLPSSSRLRANQPECVSLWTCSRHDSTARVTALAPQSHSRDSPACPPSSAFRERPRQRPSPEVLPQDTPAKGASIIPRRARAPCSSVPSICRRHPRTGCPSPILSRSMLSGPGRQRRCPPTLASSLASAPPSPPRQLVP